MKTEATSSTSSNRELTRLKIESANFKTSINTGLVLETAKSTRLNFGSGSRKHQRTGDGDGGTGGHQH